MPMTYWGDVPPDLQGRDERQVASGSAVRTIVGAEANARPSQWSLPGAAQVAEL